MESGYPSYHPTNAGERAVGFKNGFANNPELANANNFAAQGGFNNEMLNAASTFDPSTFNMNSWGFMANGNELNMAGLDSNYLTQAGNMPIMDPNYFYTQPQSMTMPMSMTMPNTMPFSMTMGNGGMPSQMMLGVNNYSGHNFGQYGSLPAMNNGFQQALAPNMNGVGNHTMSSSFQSNMNAMCIPSNSNPALMGDMNTHMNPAFSRNPSMMQQKDLNPQQQNLNFYNMALSQTYSNQMVPNFNLGTPNPRVPIPQMNMDALPQQPASVAQISPAIPNQEPSTPQKTPINTPFRSVSTRQTPTPQKTIESFSSREGSLGTPGSHQLVREAKTPQPSATPKSAVTPQQRATPQPVLPKQPVRPPSPPRIASQEQIKQEPDIKKEVASKEESPEYNFPRLADGDYNKEMLRECCLSSRNDFYRILNTVSQYKEDPESPVLFMDKPIDLHVLWSSIIELGGPVECGRTKNWTKIRERLAVDCPQSKVPTKLKLIWRKYLQSLEGFLYPDHAAVVDKKYKKSESKTPIKTSFPTEAIDTQIKSEPHDSTSIIESPAVTTGSPEEPVAKRPRYEHPPRSQPYDYVPFYSKIETYGGADVVQLHTAERLAPIFPSGEVRIQDITMGLLSQTPMAIGSSLRTLLALSSSTPVVLDSCQRLTEALLELIKSEFGSLFPTPPKPSTWTYELLAKKYYEETLEVRTKDNVTPGPVQRLAFVFTILSNLSFHPENQLHLANQTDLVGWLFLVVQAPLANDFVGELLDMRKQLLLFLSNILGHWVIHKDALKPTSRLPTQIPPQTILNLLSEFLSVPNNPQYPALALECLAKLTTLDSHRVLLAAAPLAPWCAGTLKVLSELLQGQFPVETDPIDEQKLVYLQYLLMSICNLIDILGPSCNVSSSLPPALMRTARWLTQLEAFERGLKEPRNSKTPVPNPSSYLSKVPLPKPERQDVLVKLATRALGALNALFCLPSSQDSTTGGTNLLICFRSNLVELMTFPSIDGSLSNYISTILKPVENIVCLSS